MNTFFKGVGGGGGIVLISTDCTRGGGGGCWITDRPIYVLKRGAFAYTRVQRFPPLYEGWVSPNEGGGGLKARTPPPPPSRAPFMEIPGFVLHGLA